MNRPWRRLSTTEKRVLARRETGEDVSAMIELLRSLLLQVEVLPDADRAICFHGARALVEEFDGRKEAAARSREAEIQKIEDLHELARQDPGARPALQGYEIHDLELRRRILRELQGEGTA